MQSHNVRPVSTYDNLSASSGVHTSTPKSKPAPMPQTIELSYGAEHELAGSELDVSSIRCDAALNGSAPQSPAELNGGGTSHSIAATKAALNDAKSKFFGINNYEEMTPLAPPASVKAEPKYQNVPQRNVGNQAPMPVEAPAAPPTLSDMLAMPLAKPSTTSATPSRSLRYATYEEIPLSDLDAPQASQAVYMSTTVPQNIKGMKIAGRHTPTRNSLRHSRMIVVNNKTTDTVQEAYTAHVRKLNLSRQLLSWQLCNGSLLICLAVYILFQAPNASILINPYLSGLALLLASIAGLFLLRRNHRKSENRPRNNCHRVLLVESYVFSALALIFCCLALVCSAIEFAELVSGTGACTPTNSFLGYSNCTCSLGEQQPLALEPTVAESVSLEAAAAATATAEKTDDEIANKAADGHNCQLIRNEWKYLLGFSMALNAMGIISTFLYITLYICCHRSREHFYTSV